MSNVRTFEGVTKAVLEYLNRTGRGDFHIDAGEDGRSGTVTGASGLGRVSLHFEYDEPQAEITLTILKKPMLAPVPLLWAEFSYAVIDARRALSLAPLE